MTIVVPRLEREAADAMVARLVGLDLDEISAAIPTAAEAVTYSPVGGTRIDDHGLRVVRAAIVALAREHGMPDALERSAVFEGRAARVLHGLLPMTPHEAAHEEVWSYLTCCWLLDVAVWRFGRDADTRRFIGNVNRNTFRRMWWRAEVLGPEIPLDLLGEDELVNIMERPTIAADRRLARAIAREFLDRVERGDAAERMQLMREAMKRLLRVTPFVAFAALDDGELTGVVTDAFDAAAAGIAGETVAITPRAPAPAPAPTDDVVAIPRFTIATGSERTEGAQDSAIVRDFDTVTQAALDIARRTGRVTNMNLREVVAITSDEAREVFQTLMQEGRLVRRGVKRGTHYVLPDEPAAPALVSPSAFESEQTVSTPPPSPQRPTAPTKSSDTPLRRLLRRGR